ncbi:MAG: universal stress protein [Rhizobacter sp.]|nr:universal stress protein [Burkholderiaceae bacterium]MCO5123848.1 universal stress protein [Rhizobacter sp.]
MYERIMIVVDEGAIARAALDEGLALAQVHAAEVVFFHVLPNFVLPLPDMPAVASLGPESHRKAVQRVARRVLAAAQQRAGVLGVAATSQIGADVDAAECIARAAAEHRCQLIVIGSHGRSAIQRLVFGSVVSGLIARAPVPVLVCKKADKRPVTKGARALAPAKRRRVTSSTRAA